MKSLLNVSTSAVGLVARIEQSNSLIEICMIILERIDVKI